jgi:hypothetical protein
MARTKRLAQAAERIQDDHALTRLHGLESAPCHGG